MHFLIGLVSRASVNGSLRKMRRLGASFPLVALIAVGTAASLPQAAMATTLTITTTTLPIGYVGSNYSKTLVASGGSGTGYTWTISAGSLPAGLSLTSGVITGKPTTAGTTNFTLKVTDSAANSATAAVSIQVKPAVAVTTTKLATGYLNIAYSATLTATGGTGIGYTWSIPAGTLPAGLSLTSATGVISGKPTVKGSSSVTFKVTDSLGHTASASLVMTVNADLSITTTKLPVGYVTTKYSVTLASAGGSGTGNTWSLLSGTIPAGITLSSAGVLSGTPTASGAKTLTVQIKDSDGNTASAAFTLTVNPALSVTSARILPVGYAGSNYSTTLTAAGGSGAGYKFTATSTLPQGLTLTSAGVLSGLPAVAATSSISVTVTDSASNVAKPVFTLVIDPAVASCTNDQQTTALVELHGVYTFEFNRFNLGNNARSWSIGSFNADGLGNILNGVMDTNGPEFPAEVQNTFTGTYTVGSDGRGRMDLKVAGSTQTNTFCYALDTFSISSSKTAAHATVIEDDQTNNVVSGEFYHQTTNPTVASMKGTWVVGFAGKVHNPYGTDLARTVVGYATLDGAGILSGGEVDENQDTIATLTTLGTDYTPKLAITGTYTLPVPVSGTPTGRGTIKVTSSQGTSNFIFYPAGSNYMAILESDSADPGSASSIQPAMEGRGYKRAQTTFSNATGLIGSSVRSRRFLTNPYASNENVGVGIDVAVWDGAGNFTYAGDTSAGGIATTPSGSGTYAVDTNGRFAVMQAGVCAPCGYLIKSDAGLAIYDSTDAAFETLEFQDVPIGGAFQLSGMQGGYSVGDRWFERFNQLTRTGELITDGAGNFKGTLDQNRQGNTQVNLATLETESATATSGAHGRFLLMNNNGTSKFAVYLINKNSAVGIDITGSSTQTQPLNLFTHQ